MRVQAVLDLLHLFVSTEPRSRLAKSGAAAQKKNETNDVAEEE